MNCANHPDRERIAFCQNCGKPLCQECTRTVGSAVFCEPCLIAKLAGTSTSNPAGYGGPSAGANYTADSVIPPPPDEPNPGLAAILGFIPGVGAMYNGQYAKGIVHLIVFVVLISLTSDANGLFGFFIAGWVLYQVIEAHHTAQARRDGTPLPNPFGLNDLGERLGFGKAWPTGTHGPAYGPPATPVPDATVPPAAGSPPPSGYPPPYPPPPTASWGASWESYSPPIPPAPPFTGPVPPTDLNSYPSNRFPTGAVWLIALGAIFLVGNSGMFHGYSIHWLLPLLLIGFGVWQFVHKMTETGSLADDGTAAYKFRLFHALRSSVWIMLVGLLFLLDTAHILSWTRSWPLFLIVAGLMAVLRMVTFSAAAAVPYNPYTTPPEPAASPRSATTSIVPSNTHNDDEEGK
ncbi:MAG: DUF5668 domain-containing protein [Edaphobacter sp.]